MKTNLLLTLFSVCLMTFNAEANFNSSSYNALNTKKSSISFGSKSSSLLVAKLGGDEVGNGGDDIRLNFMKISEQTLLDSPEIQNNMKNFEALKNSISIKKIFVIDQLKIDGANAPFAVTDNVILLDRQSWNSLDGILADNVDPRLEILRLMSSASQVNYSEEELLSIYSTLPYYRSPSSGEKKAVAPLCIVKESAFKTDKTMETFNASSKDAQEAKSLALKTCASDSRLTDCRILELKESGFAGFVKFHAVAQGILSTTRNFSKQEQRAERCLELQRCSDMYEIAPTGQIPSQSFNKLDKEISLSCQQ